MLVLWQNAVAGSLLDDAIRIHCLFSKLYTVGSEIIGTPDRKLTNNSPTKYYETLNTNMWQILCYINVPMEPTKNLLI